MGTNKRRRKSISRYQRTGVVGSKSSYSNATRTIRNTWKRALKGFAKHRVGIIGLAGGVFIPLLVLWWNSLEPDIHLIPRADDSGGEILDQAVDGTGHWYIHHMRLLLRFKNFSLKSGIVDRVEFIPLKSVVDLPQIKEVHIDKQPIGWRAEKQIEVKFIMAAPCDLVIERETEIPPTLPGDRPKLEIEVSPQLRQPSWEFQVRAFDNTGKSIETNMHDTRGKYVLKASPSIDTPSRSK